MTDKEKEKIYQIERQLRQEKSLVALLSDGLEEIATNQDDHEAYKDKTRAVLIANEVRRSYENWNTLINVIKDTINYQSELLNDLTTEKQNKTNK